MTRLGAVLLVEDSGWTGAEVTERLGAALYGRLLEAGAYTRVVHAIGRASEEGGNRRWTEQKTSIASTCAASPRRRSRSRRATRARWSGATCAR